MAKIDPYLRPLFDALHDMIDPEKVAGTWRAGSSRSRRWRSCAAER
jgi:phosphate starvation-inducible protein PhoH